MKKVLKSQNKALRVSCETVRNLGDSRLVDVVGGSVSNNGCGHGLSGSTYVEACVR